MHVYARASRRSDREEENSPWRDVGGRSAAPRGNDGPSGWAGAAASGVFALLPPPSGPPSADSIAGIRHVERRMRVEHFGAPPGAAATAVRCLIFPAGPRLCLAVEVQGDAGHGAGVLPLRRPRGPEVPEEIRHRGGPEELRRPERQAAHGAHLLLELARDAGVDREVAGVVRARSDLVDEEAAVPGVEELDAEDADEIQRVEKRSSDVVGKIFF